MNSKILLKYENTININELLIRFKTYIYYKAIKNLTCCSWCNEKKLTKDDIDELYKLIEK